jgi:hypothetical protein
MRISEVIPTNEDFSSQIVAVDPVISQEDTARILAVQESNFSEPMSGDELVEHMKSVLGIQ